MVLKGRGNARNLQRLFRRIYSLLNRADITGVPRLSAFATIDFEMDGLIRTVRSGCRF
jgi:hypothetical protein